MVGLAIETDALTKRFGAFTAVDGLRLRVPTGTVYGFIGPNGAGKTTTMHLLLGILAPDEGSAYVLGLDTRREAQSIRAHCAALLEHHGLYERLSAFDNLEFQAKICGISKAEREARYRELLEPMDLWERRHERVAKWSKGMKQKVAIARVLLARPRIVFLDEPTNGLDPQSAYDIRQTLEQLARDEGVTVFLNTHNLAEAEKTCDRVAVLNRGRIVAEGPPEQLTRGDSTVLEVRLGKTTKKAERAAAKVEGVEEVTPVADGLVVRLAARASGASLVKCLVEAGAAVEEVRRVETGLEDAFLALLREDAA